LDFSKELKEQIKTYFLNRFGIVLSDDKANSYLYSLGQFGLILAELPDNKDQGHNAFPGKPAFAERTAAEPEHRKAGGRKAKGTALVTQCPQSANKLNTSRNKKLK
jgi:hypothetical protein